MGCHTWCYKKIGSWEEVIKDVDMVKVIEKEIFSYINWKYRLMITDPDTDLDDLKAGIKYLELLNRLRQLLEKGKLQNSDRFKDFVLDMAKEHDKEFKNKYFANNLFYKNGNIYTEVSEYGNNLFRLHTYDVELTSYQDTRDHLKKHYDPDNIYRDGVLNKELLREFWKKYPDGLIRLG